MSWFALASVVIIGVMLSSTFYAESAAVNNTITSKATPSTTQKTTASTTKQTTASTTQKPTASTTQKPTASTTQKPTASTTQKPTASTTKETTHSTTKQTIASTTQKPTASTTKETTHSTTKQTTASTTQKPTASTTKETTHSTTQKPTASTTKQTTASTTQKPTASTTQKPTASTTKETTPSTTQKPTASTTKQTTASTTQKTTASTTKETTHSTTKQTTASTTQKTTASTTKETTHSTTQKSTASTTKQTTASTTQQTTTVGCFADFYPTSRAMSGASTTSSSNTPSTCAAYCSSLGFSYSGTEYANECYCSIQSPTTVSNACTMACAGDSTKVCGGANAISVVYTSIPTLPATNSTKRGLCWPWNNPVSSFAFFSPNAIPWLYNWELWDPRPNGTYSKAEYVPMCRTQTEASQVAGYFSKCYATHLLGFNEPDLPTTNGGNYISPKNASDLWKQYIQPVKALCGTSLGAPAVTNGVGSGWGTDWLSQFFDNCTSPSCSFDFIQLHWYGTSLSDFENYVTQFHSLFPAYPLWITEWQFTGQSSTTTAFLEKQALKWLDAQNYIVRYAMFGPMNSANMAGITNGAMITDDLSALTNVGKIYAGLM